MTEDLQEIRARGAAHQEEIDARPRAFPRRSAREFFNMEQAAALLGVSVDMLLRFVPPSLSPSPRNPRWSSEDLSSLDFYSVCHVYAIRRADTREVKIGISTNPVRRLRDLQSNHARKLELLLAFPGMVEHEVALHTRFKAHRLRGEWFDEVPEITTWIEDVGGCPALKSEATVENIV